MKKVNGISIRSFLVTLIISCSTVFAQLNLNEEFDYGASTGSLTSLASGWAIHSGGTTNAISYNTSSITFPGYPATIGGSVQMITSGQDLNKALFSPITAGDTYASFLVNVQSAQATGDYMFHLIDSYGTNAGTNFKGRVSIKSSLTGFNFGITKGGTASYSGQIFNFNTTYLVVLKYSIVGGSTNDVVSLFVFDSSIPSSEPAPFLVATDNLTTSDLSTTTGISSVALRQGTAANAPILTVDGIRVGTNWNDVLGVPIGPVSVTGFSFIAPQTGLSGSSSGTTISGNHISVLFPSGSVLSGSSLVPTFTFSRTPTTIEPSSTAGQDFSVPVVYTIDGISLYTVTSSVSITLSSANSITGFTLAATNGVIMGTMINVTVPFGTNLATLTATGTASPLATVNPSFITIQDYSSMVLFTVTAQDLSMQVYTVTAILGPPPSDANSITGFTLFSNQIASTIDQAAGLVSITIPGAIYISGIIPIAVTISPKATISPSTATSFNFHSMQSYTVTAESGLKKAYNVTVTAAIIPDMIYALSSVGVNVVEPMNTVSGQYLSGWARLKGDGSPIPPNDSDHWAVVNNTSSFSTGTGYAFASGGVNVIISNAGDFGSGVFMLTSAGYNTSNWKNLKVNWGYRKTSTFETGGTLPTLEWSRNGTTWNMLTYSHNTAGGWASVSTNGIPLPIQAENKANIYFRFAVTTSGTNNGNYRIDDFYLTGEAGVNTLSGENAITNFAIPNQLGTTTISGNNIYVVLPSGSLLTAVVPGITISGLATVFPNSGTPIDLSSLSATYTVTSQAETDNVYTIHAYVLSDANQVLSLTYLPQSANGLTTTVTGTITGTSIYVDFPANVTVSGLVPVFSRSPLATGNIPAGTPITLYLSGTEEYPDKFAYTVTSEDGTSQPYNIFLKVLTTSDTTGTSTITGISESLSKSFEIYPNPASVSFKVTKSDAGLEIYNSLGVKVLETPAGTSETSVSTAALNKGVYFVKVKGLPSSKVLVIE